MSVRRLHPVQPDSFKFTAENFKWVEALVKNFPQRKQASAVIPVLWRAQEQIGGWITRPAIEYVAKLLDMSFVRVYEIATFYTMFQLSPVGRKAHVQVCGTTPCMLRGAEDLINICRHRIHNEPHHTSADGNFSWEEVECLGACVNAPMVQIWKDTYEDLTPEIFERILDDLAKGKEVKPGPQNGRQMTAPLGELTSLTDTSIYAGERRFTRIDALPPASPQPAKVLEPQKAKEAAAVTKAPAIPADAQPAKRAAAETQRVTPSTIAGEPPASAASTASKAASRQKSEKSKSPAGRSAPKNEPPKKDPA